MEPMWPVVLNERTVEVLKWTVASVEFAPEGTAAVGAALVRGSFRTGDESIIFDTRLTQDEMANVWAVLQAFVDIDPLSKVRPEHWEDARLTLAMVQAAQEVLVRVAGMHMQPEQPPKRKGRFRAYLDYLLS